jgi:hypothetical protein
MNIANRPLLVIYYICYFVSTTLLLIASLSKTPLPAWGGYVDVGLVVLIVVLSFTIFGRGKADPKFEIGHRAALNLLPIILLGLWVFRNALDFNILLPGLAWRTFFFLHILPYAVNLWKPADRP